jgi:hypothetical protein
MDLHKKQFMKYPKSLLNKMNKKPSIKQLDDLCRKIIRLRDKKCRVCNSDKFLQVAHFITRSNKQIRWDLDNLFLLCSGCHQMRRDSWHKDPASATEWVNNALGTKRFKELRMRACNIGSIDRSAVMVYLEQELGRIT